MCYVDFIAACLVKSCDPAYTLYISVEIIYCHLVEESHGSNETQHELSNVRHCSTLTTRIYPRRISYSVLEVRASEL